MLNSLKLWSPGPPSLAVPVQDNQRELTWDQLQVGLLERLREIAELEDRPVDVLEAEWRDQVGDNLQLIRLEDLLVAEEFRVLLRDRHNLSPDQFPMKVAPPFEDADPPNNLWEWVRDLK